MSVRLVHMENIVICTGSSLAIADGRCNCTVQNGEPPSVHAWVLARCVPVCSLGSPTGLRFSQGVSAMACSWPASASNESLGHLQGRQHSMVLPPTLFEVEWC